MGETVAQMEYTLGRTVQWSGFSSTSTNIEKAKAFVRETAGVIYCMHVKSGRNISEFSSFPSEEEILLLPNTRFHVVKELHKGDDGNNYVELAESVENDFIS